MEYTAHLSIFAVLLFGIIVVPGMDMIYVLANALAGGTRSGVAAISGIMVGGLVHTLTGTLGVTVLSVLLPKLFLPMLLLGAAYMIWIGIGLLRSSVVVDTIDRAATRSPAAVFRGGLVTCLLNPKAWLFIMAVYPQFMRPDHGPIVLQAIIMGALTIAMQLVIYGVVALGAGQARRLLIGNASATIAVGRAAGALIILAAIYTAWQGWTDLA
jgi:threonine/homoserine/homoserine lactone efflux protein